MKSLLKLSLTAFCLLLPIQFLLAQETDDYMTSAGEVSPVPLIIGLLIALLMIVAMWKVFTKAGQPGWASIIPIYNLYIWCKIVGRPWWWILLMLIPFVNFIVGIILCIDTGEELRQRRRLRNWPRFTGNYLLADPWFRQCAISRRCGCEAVAMDIDISACTAMLECFSAFRFSGVQLRGRTEPGGLGSEPNSASRFSLKAAIPSRASLDSRACI